MTHKGTLPLETERLILRRFREDDAEAMFKNWASDPEVPKFMTWELHSDVIETQKVLSDWINSYDNPEYYHWAIELKDISEIIGSIGCDKVNNEIESVHMGYCIGSKFWHKGYMTEALTAVIRFLFEEVGVNRIQACHDPRNPNSGAVMKKCGLQYEGTHRQSGKNNMPGFCDEMWYAILAEDYLYANMETTIRTVLTDESQSVALDYVAHLRSNGVEFERGGGYWADKNYYIARYNNEAVCFILINADETNGEPLGFILWSDDSPHNSYANAPLDTLTKEITWQHVDICGNCGGCGNSGGSHKTILGKEFDNVCITTFRFDNPNVEETECAKKLIEIQIKDIMIKKKGINT
jgi:ribosomal-protein-alanine N-acetyltransferase